MTYVLKVTKPTYNVLTETSLDNFNIHSSYNTFKYYVSGNVEEYVANGDFETQTITGDLVTHDLGYVPFFNVIIKTDLNANYWLTPHYELFNGSSSATYIWITATTTKISYAIKLYTTSDPAEVNYIMYFKVFKNRLF